jgi:hypothetical protein
MPFTYTFPIFFDEPIILAGEVGLGVEAAVLNASFILSEGGTGNESSAVLNNIFGSDGGGGADIIKILTGKAGHDLRLQTHFGQVNITHKEVNL